MPLYNPTSSSSSLLPVTSKTANYTILTTDSVILCDASSASFTLTLPTAVGISGKVYYIKRTDQTLANAVTLSPQGGEFIDTNVSKQLSTQNEEWSIVSDGTDWRVLYHDYQQKWISYTPTFTGFGTPSVSEVFWRRDGESIQIRGKIVSGTSTATEARISFPSGVQSSTSTLIPSRFVAGYYVRDALVSSVVNFPILQEASATFFTFGKQSSGDTPFSKQNGNQIVSTGENFGFLMSSPIANWEP